MAARAWLPGGIRDKLGLGLWFGTRHIEWEPDCSDLCQIEEDNLFVGSCQSVASEVAACAYTPLRR